MNSCSSLNARVVTTEMDIKVNFQYLFFFFFDEPVVSSAASGKKSVILQKIITPSEEAAHFKNMQHVSSDP